MIRNPLINWRARRDDVQDGQVPRSAGKRESGLELRTAWFVVFRLISYILLYFNKFVQVALSNKISLFGLIWPYSGLFRAFYWTAKVMALTNSPFYPVIQNVWENTLFRSFRILR